MIDILHWCLCLLVMSLVLAVNAADAANDRSNAHAEIDVAALGTGVHFWPALSHRFFDKCAVSYSKVGMPDFEYLKEVVSEYISTGLNERGLQITATNMTLRGCFRENADRHVKHFETRTLFLTNSEQIQFSAVPCRKPQNPLCDAGT